jgi:hypothetical protein
MKGGNMPQLMGMRGDKHLRQIETWRTSQERLDRVRYLRWTARMRAYVDLLLGSAIPSEEKDGVILDTFTDVLAGRSEVAARAFSSEEEFEQAIRSLLSARCQALFEA